MKSTSDQPALRLLTHYLSLLAIILILTSEADAAIKCYECHGTTIDIFTGDYRPVDANGRDAATGGFKGNHRTHMAQTTNAAACAKCHPGSASYQPSHRDGHVKVSARLNNSPITTTYNNSTSAWHQTTAPSLGKCTSVNCHFERESPTWGADTFASSADCQSCHTSPGPSSSHNKHESYFPFSANGCTKCHSDYKTDLLFSHATSAANRGILVKLSEGSYSGSGANFLPSQSGSRVLGTCSDLYCHSPGDKNTPPYNPPVQAAQWGNTLDCSGCHGYPPAYATSNPKANSHPAHNSLTCNNCHLPTTNNGTSITTPANHINKNVELLAGSGVTFSYSYAADGGSCTDISCHPTSYKTGKWGETACLECHAIALNNRAAITAQFGANSHHIQGEVTDAKCHQCHWEANSDGTINPSYHSGSATPGAPVNLVVYGNQSRPATYTSGVTAVEYTADNTRTQIQKINNHCLGCHNEQNSAITPFADGYAPGKYAWDGKSVDARYSQSGTTTWGKYSTTKGANKRIKKAYSAHANTAVNQRGWSGTTGVDGAISNTSGTVGIQCYDCHNSHGSTAAGITSRYSSATGRNRGGILKDTVAGKGGYSVAYKPYTSGSTENKNRLNPGANLCLDCHLSQTDSTTPWGYNSTFGATQPILSYWDALSYKGYSTSGAKSRYSFKGLNPKMGGHFGASSSLAVQPSPDNQINGLCTPCHDPHGVSPTLAGDQQYAVPLLKGTWITSPYREDTAPAINARMTNRTDLGKEGVPYNIDQNTFGSGLITAVTGITQTEDQAEGLCLRCHEKSSLTDGVTHTWKSKDRIHESVKGWKTANATVKHGYSCSKCHSPHTNSTLPRLMVTNCLDSQHKGRTSWANAVTSASGYGEFLLNSNTSLHKCTEIPASYGWCDISNWPNGGRGSGRFPGGWKGTNYRFGDFTVACHEGQTGGAADQSWNEVTPWGFYPPMTNTVPSAVASGLQAAITWSTNIPGSSTVNYGLTSAYGASVTDPASVFNHSVTLTSLTNHKTYHYQVNSVNPDGKQITSIDYTVPYISLPPTVPVLVAQSNGVCDANCSRTLQWNASTDPDSGPIEYQVQVDTSASFSTGNLQTSTWTTGTSWNPVLATNSTWYWRVQARDADHITAQDPTSGWSTTSSFILLTGVPATPTMGVPSVLSTSIRWNFTDYANNEVGFKTHDPANDSLKSSAATINLAYFDETGLTANTRYIRHVHAYNAIGDSRPSADVSIYTLSAAPNVTANKTTSTWYSTAGVTFTNAAGFGSGGVQYYRYAWNQNPTHVFNGNEAPWTGNNLTLNTIDTGRWYLHVKAYNGDNVANGTQDYGPYYYDITPPSGLGNSAPSNGALNLPINTRVYSTIAADNDSAQVQYWFQVATDSGFSAGLQESGWQSGTNYAPPIPYADNTTYFWRVKAKDALGNETAYTPVWSFKTTQDFTLWTTKGHFETNTTRSLVEVSGNLPGEDASVILNLKRLSRIAAGRYHSLALRDDGSVWAWGKNWYNQTGNSATPSTPLQIPALGPGSGVIEIAAGEYNSLFAKADGSVWGMGEWFGSTPRVVTNLGSGAGAIKIAVGAEHFMALKSDGSVWTWGVRNWYGQVGNGTTSSVSNPIEVLPPSSGVLAVAAGDSHSLALKSDGSVIAWGENGSGRLGDGTTTNRYAPVAVSGLGSGSGVIAVSAGDSHSLALKSDGSVWAWGSGFGSTPVQVPTLWPASGVTAITAGYNHSLALKSDGSVWGFGGSYGATPVEILPAGSGINAIAAGDSFSLALQANHHELAWGANGSGQLGTGNTTNVTVPVQNLMYGVYNSPGTISNLKFDAGSSKYWGTISWSGTTPANTGIKFRSRGAGTEAGLTSATWSSFYTSSGSPVTTEASRWLEVELTEQSSDGIYTPTLDDATVTYVTDPILPFVTAFTATSPSTSWNIPITSFIANGSSAVTGYLITNSATVPSAGDAGWSGSVPAIYAVAADGTYTLYPWAKDAAGNVSAVFVSPVSVNVDKTVPEITAFTATSPSTGNITIASFSATDNIGVTGYLITTSATPPSVGAAGWSGSAPATYTVTAEGTYTLYPWVKDAAGNVSAVFGSPVSVNVAGIDTTAPLVWSFTAAPASGTVVVPISSFTASDNAGVTAYLITTSATPPAVGAAGWTGTPPATYTIPGGGTYNLYPWVKDAAGNVSPVFGSPVSVSYDATRPIVTAFTATAPSGNRNITIASFTATDNISVAGYLVTTSSTPPSSGDTGWSASAPTTYPVASDGRYTLYPWAKDTAGNVSSVFGTPVTLTVDASAAVSVNDGFNPNTNNNVSTIAVQTDGKIVIGGSFTTVGGVARNRIARLNTNGTLDTTFNPDLNNFVNTLAIQADGKILIGGNFTTVNGISRNTIARLNPDGSIDHAFNTTKDGDIHALAIQADGKIVIGGWFTNVGGVARNSIARLNVDGSVDTSFNPNSNEDVTTIAIQADGKILIGGDFTTIGGIGRTSIARLNADGSLDTSFVANTTNGTNYATSFAIQPDGKIVVGGYFTSINGTTRNSIARLNADGSLDSSFDPNANSGVRALALHPDGKILVSGVFNNIAGTTRNYIARLNADGSLDTDFTPNVNSNVNSIAIEADGKILIGGQFSTVNGAARNNIARLNADGNLDNFFDASANNFVNSIAVQTDGKIIIGGQFTTVGGTARSYIAQLNPDSTVVTSFNPEANNYVNAIAVQADGKIIIGGTFTTIGGTPRNRIARLNADGSLDTLFDPSANGAVSAIAIQADGKIVIGGTFSTIGGVTRNCIARLNADGTLDTLNANTNGAVGSLAIQADGKIVFGGSFTTVNGTGRNYIARLNANGSLDIPFNPTLGGFVSSLALKADDKIIIGGYIGAVIRLNTDGSTDTSFNTSLNNTLYTLAAQADGKILIGGAFTTVGGVARNRIARLNPDGSVDTSFDPNAGNIVNALAIQGDGKIIVGGTFTTVGGYTRNYIARLTNSDDASQSLSASVDGTSVTWLRSGTVPEVDLVTFERSSDNSTWTLLGSGTRSSGGWQLTGLSLPVGQHFIRARGTARGGYGAGSSSLIETVVQSDVTNPLVTAFAATSPSLSKNIPITSFTASSDAAGGITGYMITTSPAPPSYGAAGWSSTAPATFTATADGTYTLYPWVKDAVDNVSMPYGSPASVAVETTPPSVTAFIVPSTSTSLVIPISSFTASDSSGAGISGYLVTTSSTQPSAEAAGWSGSAPATYEVADDGVYTLYPWAKDTAGNVSTPSGSPVSVSVDTAAPSVTEFTTTNASATRDIPITSFTANDNLGESGITGYLITTSSTPPSAGAAGWSASAPTIYPVAADGAYTLYPWAKNVVDFVSPVFGSPVSVIVDTVAPGVTAFSAATHSASLNIPINPFTASDSVGVTGYLITTSATPPTAGAAGWSGSAPATYTVSGNGAYTLYPWAKDAAGNISSVSGSPASVIVDTIAPSVTLFTVVSPSASWNIPIASFSASDSVGVTGYMITASSAQPSAEAAGWTGTAPTTFTVAADGAYTLYPWAKDAAGNVSAVVGSPVTVTVNSTLPSVTSFNATSPSSSWIIPVTSFTASDNGGGGITGYLITTTSTPPLVGAAGWTGGAPVNYTVTADGTYTLYPWAKDAAGNVSPASSSPVSVSVDTTRPSVTAFTATSPSASRTIAINTFTAGDNVAITGYLITTSSTQPAAGAAGWTAGAPVTYTVAVDGAYTLYPWAKDAAGNVSAVSGSPASVSVDTTRPSVTAFTVASSSTSQNIPISSFTVNDNIAVTGYLITTSLTQPSAAAAGWSGSVPATYTVTADGSYFLYPWVKDAAGNVSTVFGTPRSVVVESSPPSVTAFTATSPSSNKNIPITSFTAGDNVGVTGYLITTTSTPPSVGAGGWSVTAPASFAVAASGTYTLYPWAKDATGNVSAVSGSPVTVVVDTSSPVGLANLLPADTSRNQPADITLTANASDSSNTPIQYMFQLATDIGFQYVVNSSGWQSGTSYTPAPSLEIGPTYYWHVKAKDSLNNETPYTDTWKFTTAPYSVDWTYRGDFESNASTSGSTTSRSNVQVIGGSSSTDNSALVSISRFIASGDNHSLAVKPDGSVWSWGYNNNGQLGNSSCCVTSPSPVQVTGFGPDSGVIVVAAGSTHSLALKSDGSVWAWGANNYGQIGNGASGANVTSPVQVSGLGPNSGVITVSTKGSFSLALKADGSVWAWGYNGYGQLANGNTTNSAIPVQVSGLTGVIAVAAGNSHALAVKSDGSIWSWGQNGAGALGDGSTTDRAFPVQVSQASGLVPIPGEMVIAAGTNHSMALTSDGSVWAWGSNSNGQLGDNSTTSRNTPVPVSGLPAGSGVIALAGGSYHSLAVKSNGTVWAWGRNGSGQLGDGSTTQRLTPVQVSGTNLTSGAIAVTAGGYYSLAMKSDGTVWGWGDNQNSQFGNGSWDWSPTTAPIQSLMSVHTPEPGIISNLTYDAGVKVDLGSVFWNARTPANSAIRFRTRGAATAAELAELTPADWSDYHASSGSAITSPNSRWLELEITIQQSGGFTPTLDDISVTYDAIKPVSTINTPLNGVTIHRGSGEPYSISGSATDEIAVQAIEVSTDGGSTWNTASCTGCPGAAVTWTFPWELPADGAYTIRSRATNSSSNVEIPKAGNNVTLDNNPTDAAAPSSSVTIPADLAALNSTTAANPFAINGTAADNAGVLGIEVSMDGGGTWHSASCTGCPNAAVTWQYNWTLPADGNYTIRSRAIDTAGNVESPAAGNAVTLDRVAPIGLSNATPANNAFGLPATMSVNCNTASDVTSGGVQYYFEVATDSNFTTAVQQSEWQSGTGFSPAGLAGNTTYYWHVKTRDAAGNITDYTPGWSFKTMLPEVAWTSKGDFETNSVTTGTNTTISSFINISGTNPADNASVTLKLSKFSTISNGQNHTLAVKTDGTVWAWGDNNYGKLGNGTACYACIGSTPVQVTGPDLSSGAIAVAAGESHSLAIKSDGSLWAWGYNSYWQLGDGTTENRWSPVPVTGMGPGSGVIAAAGGTFHSLALKSDGSVWAWGRNNNGQLGIGSTGDRATPVQVTGLGAGSGVIAVAAGYGHSLAVKADGSVWAWGNNGYGQIGNGVSGSNVLTPVQVTGLGPGSGVISVAAGYDHSLAAKSNGSAWAWGRNNSGQLGNGGTTSSPTPVNTIDSSAGVLAVSAGYSYSLALLSDGTVYAWGINDKGQLGDNSTTQSLSPVQASGLTGAISVTAGFSHSTALKSDGSVLTWGSNGYGQLGNGATSGYRPTPLQVTGLDSIQGVQAVSASTSFSLARKADGTVWAWGDNMSGQLGDNSTIQRNAPVQVMGLPFINSISAGRLDGPPVGGFSLALDSSGNVWAWGSNNKGQFGNGTTDSSLVPVPIDLMSSLGPGVQAVSAGNSFSLALASDRSVWAWGINTYGQIGVDPPATPTGYSPNPIPVIGLGPGIQAIAAGKYHSLAVDSFGAVWAWGSNSDSQLGVDPATTPSGYSYTPVRVSGGDLASGVVAVATGASGGPSGGNFSLALKGDGSVWAWGKNDDGQLAADPASLTISSTPVQVFAPDSGIVAIAAGGGFCLALKVDGTLWAWGYNIGGQLGDGTTVSRFTPAQVQGGLSGVSGIAAAGDHSLAVKSDGSALSWGSNWFGELGYDTSNADITVPTLNLVSGVKNISSYPPTGTVTNLKNNICQRSDWGTITWSGNTPANTGIQFRTREADTEAGLASATWSAPYSTSGATITVSTSPWSEIGLTLQSSDGISTPTLDDFTITCVP